MHVVFKWYLRLRCETAVLLGFFSCANFPYLIDFSLWQPIVLINVSMVAALLQTPVSVSLAGVGPTAPVVSFHLLLSVSGCFCYMGLLSADYMSHRFPSSSQCRMWCRFPVQLTNTVSFKSLHVLYTELLWIEYKERYLERRFQSSDSGTSVNINAFSRVRSRS